MMTKQKDSPEKAIPEIHRATRRKYSAGDKIYIVPEGLRGESSLRLRVRFVNDKLTRKNSSRSENKRCLRPLEA
jgi:hypothetical protein